MVWYWSNIKIYYIVPHTVCNTHPSPLFASSPQLVIWRNRQKSSTSSSTSASADAGSTCLAATARWGLVRSLHETPGHWGLMIPRHSCRSAIRRKVRVVMLHGQIAMYCRFFPHFCWRSFRKFHQNFTRCLLAFLLLLAEYLLFPTRHFPPKAWANTWGWGGFVTFVTYFSGLADGRPELVQQQLICSSQQSDYKCPINPFTTKSDQCQISPAASPIIVHHPVWRTWLFIAYSDERWLHYQFSLPHLYIFSLKRWENVLFESSGVKGLMINRGRGGGLSTNQIRGNCDNCTYNFDIQVGWRSARTCPAATSRRTLTRVTSPTAPTTTWWAAHPR